MRQFFVFFFDALIWLLACLFVGPNAI